MNKKKFMLLSAIAMLGFGAIAPISTTTVKRTTALT